MAWPPRFLFHSGSPALDFAHTGGLGRRALWERLRRPGDLRDWAAASSLAIEDLRVEAADLLPARALREAIWWTAQAVRRGLAPPPGRLADLNAFAASPDLAPRLGPAGPGWASDPTAEALLSTLAREALDLFGGPRRQRLRECAHPRCPLLFVDGSRPGTRRWCLMRRCGNLEKTARYRGALRARREAHASAPV